MKRRFDPPALFAALSAERERRGVPWAQVAAETGVAESTIRRTARHGRFEVDGILALLQWVDRPLEHFTRDAGVPPEALRRERE